MLVNSSLCRITRLSASLRTVLGLATAYLTITSVTFSAIAQTASAQNTTTQTSLSRAPLAQASLAQASLAQTPGGPGNNPDALPSPVEPGLPSPPELDPDPLPENPPLEGTPSETGDSVDLTVCPPVATSSEPTFTATEINVVGNSVLSEAIDFQVSCFLNQPITLSDLFTLRSRVTQLYVEAGYITSGAFLPNNQELTDGLVEIQVVEGQVEDIQINGLTRLNEGYVRDRIARSTPSPLNQAALEDGLQLLQLDPLLDQVNAELTTGSASGLSLLILEVQEADAFNLSLAFDNYRSPNIGSQEGRVSVGYNNVLGIGDRLSGSLSLSEGLTLYDIGYEIPINAANGTLQTRFNNSDSRIVEDRFVNTGIRSDTTSVSVGVRQPLWQSPEEAFAIGLDFDWRQSESFILNNVPFSFSLGPENGRSQVSVLRFYQDWVKRDDKRVLAARSQFSVGLGVLGATVNSSGTDGRFFAWQGQFQWVEQLAPRLLMVTRVNGQLTPDSLLPLERFSVGGVGTVRGYAQNQLVADNALTGSLELRVPLTQNANELQLTPFIEAGGGWNNQMPNPAPGFLLGTGVGLRWQPSEEWFARLDLGVPLIDDGNLGGSLQESGIYFLINFQPVSF